MKTTHGLELLFGIFYVIFVAAICCAIAALPIGWVLNVYDLAANCDFSAPYKAEVLRGIGVFVAPLGGILGWIDIGK